ncbi:MAG: hypothetical protein ACRD50_00170 [Candidatus Acidiferrales bacterium]
MRNLCGEVVAIALLLGAAGPASAQRGTNGGFERMKTLVGEWQGRMDGGPAVRSTFKLVSEGSALVEMLNPAAESAKSIYRSDSERVTPTHYLVVMQRPSGQMEMVSVYHADGDRVAMTHYCSANNQPRMSTAPVSGTPAELEFNLTGITNLASPGAPHITRLVIVFEDQDHILEKWTEKEGAKEHTETSRLTRTK